MVIFNLHILKGEDLTLLLIINSKRTSTLVVSIFSLYIRFRYSTLFWLNLICTAKVLIFVSDIAPALPCRRLIFTLFIYETYFSVSYVPLSANKDIRQTNINNINMKQKNKS